MVTILNDKVVCSAICYIQISQTSALKYLFQLWAYVYKQVVSTSLLLSFCRLSLSFLVLNISNVARMDRVMTSVNLYLHKTFKIALVVSFID